MATARWRPHVFGARLCQLVVVELVRAQLHLSARLAALEDVIVRLGIQLAPLQHVVHGMGHGMGRGMGRGKLWRCQESLMNWLRHNARLVGRRLLEVCYRVG